MRKKEAMRLAIRDAVAADVPAMLEIYAPFVQKTAVSFEYEVPSEEEFRQRLQEHQKLLPWLVYEQDGRVLGYAYAGLPFERAAYRWNAEVSCYLAPEARRRGIGRQLYAQLEHILTALGYRRVYSVVTSANAASLAFHQALGFTEAARFLNVGFKLGRWYDVIWLEKLLPQAEDPKKFPKAY